MELRSLLVARNEPSTFNFPTSDAGWISEANPSCSFHPASASLFLLMLSFHFKVPSLYISTSVTVALATLV